MLQIFQLVPDLLGEHFIDLNLFARRPGQICEGIAWASRVNRVVARVGLCVGFFQQRYPNLGHIFLAVFRVIFREQQFRLQARHKIVYIVNFPLPTDIQPNSVDSFWVFVFIHEKSR